MRRKGIWSADGFHYTPSRRILREQQLRQRIVAATQELLAAVGPRAFTVKEAARRAGVGRTTVYKYFRDKAGLLAACRAHAARSRSRNLNWSATAARACTEKRHTRSGLTPRLAAVRHAVVALVEGLAVESDLLKDARTRGELKSSLDPHQVAVWVAALWWHELTIRGPRRDRSQPEAASLANQLESLLMALSAA